jgi:hypothetical protein
MMVTGLHRDFDDTVREPARGPVPVLEPAAPRLEPLERTSDWDAGEPPESYPWGV